jgi:hypothetical protein
MVDRAEKETQSTKYETARRSALRNRKKVAKKKAEKK